MTDKAGEITRHKIRKGLHIVKRGGVWHIRGYAHRQQIRGTLDTGDLTEATRRAMEQAGNPKPAVPMFTPEPRPVALSLDTMYEEYEKWFSEPVGRTKKPRHKPATGKVTLPMVESFVDMIGGETDTRAVTRQHLQKFINKRMDDGCSPVTIKNDFGRVRAFIREMEKKHPRAFDLDCLRGIELPDDESVTREAPEMEAVKAIIRKLHGHPTLEDVVICLVEIGCRPGELLAARGVDIEGNLLKIRNHLVNNKEWSPKSKWSVRSIQITETAARILNARRERLFDKNALLFGLDSGKMRSTKYTSAMYRDALRDDNGSMPAAFKPVNLYALKHFFCSIHASPGPAFMEPTALAAYIGHGPGSTHTLERWYVDARALRRAVPVSLLGEATNGEVIALKK